MTCKQKIQKLAHISINQWLYVCQVDSTISFELAYILVLGYSVTMSHRWNRDYERLSRPPVDIAKHAADTLTAWVLLIFFCIITGWVLIALGVKTD